MKPSDVLNFFGSTYMFNKKTKMSASTLQNWLRWGYIPENAQYKLEYLTRGQLKANGTATLQ